MLSTARVAVAIWVLTDHQPAVQFVHVLYRKEGRKCVYTYTCSFTNTYMHAVHGSTVVTKYLPMAEC